MRYLKGIFCPLVVLLSFWGCSEKAKKGKKIQEKIQMKLHSSLISSTEIKEKDFDQKSEDKNWEEEMNGLEKKLFSCLDDTRIEKIQGTPEQVFSQKFALVTEALVILRDIGMTSEEAGFGSSRRAEEILNRAQEELEKLEITKDDLKTVDKAVNEIIDNSKKLIQKMINSDKQEIFSEAKNMLNQLRALIRMIGTRDKLESEKIRTAIRSVEKFLKENFEAFKLIQLRIASFNAIVSVILSSALMDGDQRRDLLFKSAMFAKNRLQQIASRNGPIGRDSFILNFSSLQIIFTFASAVAAKLGALLGKNRDIAKTENQYLQELFNVFSDSQNAEDGNASGQIETVLSSVVSAGQADFNKLGKAGESSIKLLQDTKNSLLSYRNEEPVS